MPEEIRCDNRQTVLLFIAGVAMCAAFFVFGLLIGRWSVKTPDHELFGGAPAIAQPTDKKSAGSPAAPPVQAPANSALASSENSTGAPDRSAEDSSAADHSVSDRTSPDEVPSEPRAYLVRAANFTKSDDAETFAATLRNRGFTTAHTKAENGGRKVYSVVLGPYANRADASGAAAELRNIGVSNVQVVPER